MSNKFIRWYDKNPDLSHFMAFIEKLPDAICDEIAQDLIQIINSELAINHDEELLQLTQSNVGEYRRWYDNNWSLHSAIEIIRNLDDERSSAIVYLAMESVVQILSRNNDV